jgi:single-stranded-DNA-specific exonuclease
MQTIHRAKKWFFPEPVSYSGQEEGIRLPPGIVALLAERGLQDTARISSFFSSTLSDLPDPFLMKGMQEAVDILLDAMRHKKPIVVYGDYDVDGLTGAAVIALFLKEVGADSFVCQPDRQRHGYGLHSDLIMELAEKYEAEEKNAVLLTVDCGISNKLEVAIARSAGFKVIITDHHQLPGSLPVADAILNPLQKVCSFPFKGLAGVGVAFYLVAGLRTQMRKKHLFSNGNEPNLKKSLDLVAIGSICDMVPLTGVNRILVKAGMEVLQGTQRPGLIALAKEAGREDRESISPEDVAFRLGPRINAAGRLQDAGQAYRLLVCETLNEAEILSRDLSLLNEKRKRLTESIYNDCCRMVEELSGEKRVSLVLKGENWIPGVLGIVASKIVQEYYRPTILLASITDEGGERILKGSGRSVEGFDLFEALGKCSDYIQKFGGHAQAAGMTVREDDFARFSETFEEVSRQAIGEKGPVETIRVHDISQMLTSGEREFLELYKKMGPFGAGNPEPIFAAHGCRLIDGQVIGEQHLRFKLALDDKRIYPGIAFGRAELLPLIRDQKIDLAFYLRLNQFRGEERWQVYLIDIGSNTTD